MLNLFQHPSCPKRRSMTDNPTLSPQRQPKDQDAALPPNVARELGVGFRATSGPVIAKSGDLAALLTNLEPHDVLFIDEIHRLNPVVEEVLYPAMEDRALDLIIGEGPSARSVRIDLPRFTLVGAATRQGLITTPLRDRFGIPVRLNFYTADELEQGVRRAARLRGLALTEDGAHEIARR